MQDRYYSRLGGMFERLKIHKVRQMKGMEDQRNTMLDGKNERLGILTFRRKWCKLEILQVGWNDGGLEILKVRWQGCKIGNTQGQVEGMRDKKYSRFVGRDER